MGQIKDLIKEATQASDLTGDVYLALDADNGTHKSKNENFYKIFDTLPGGGFTPILTFGGGSTGLIYATQQGRYFRIGNIVFFIIRIALSNKGSSTGAATISGLPYTAKDSISGSSFDFTSRPGAYASLVDHFIAISGGSNIISLYALNAAATAITDSSFSNSTSFQYTGFYFTEQAF